MPTTVLPHFLQSAFLPSSIMKFVSRSFHHHRQKLGWSQENTSAQADQISFPSLLLISQSRTFSRTPLSSLIYPLFSPQAKGKSVFRIQSWNRCSHRYSSQDKVRLWMQKSECNLNTLLINTTTHFKPQAWLHTSYHHLAFSGVCLVLWKFFPTLYISSLLISI